MELLLNMTIGGTITACMLLLIKLLLKDKLTPKWHFYLWIILMIRLVLPGLPESDISLLNNIPVTQIRTISDNTLPNTDTISNQDRINYIEGSLVMKSPVSGTIQERSFNVPKQKANILFLGWLSGVVLMMAYLAGAYWFFIRRIKRLPLCNDAAVVNLFEECKAETGITKGISIRAGGTTPMLQGVFRPTILIPEGFSFEELRHILIHELCHYKHKDILINVICSAFLCIYWFNPIMWICFYVIRRDLEILCDESAIEITGERKEYARTLLKTALKRNQFLFATTSMQNGEKEVAKRIKHIAYFKKPKFWVTGLAILVVLVTGLVCLTDASSSNTVNYDVGNGYFMKIPESWIKNKGDSLFYNKEGENFGGVKLTQVDLGNNKKNSFETVSLPLPNHSDVLERKVLKEENIIITNLNFETESAAQIAERNAAGDNSPPKIINQNYIFLLPDSKEDYLYTIWANSSEVSEKKLLKIARTLQKDPYPQGYQPEASFHKSWKETSDDLMKQYFRNYVDADMSMSSDISGYQIDKMEPRQDQDASWSVIYPSVKVYRVDYTLKIAHPDQYSFPGGGFQIGEGNRTKIYKDQLAVFQKDNIGNAKFLGFVWQQDIGEMGEPMAILRTIAHTDAAQSPAALLKLKMPYIGDHSRVGNILRSLPLAGFSTGLELHTKAEPYGLTVNYDMTELGDKIFESRPDRLPTDSSGWNPNPYIQAQLNKNSAILLSLIDNCSTVEFKITGMSENGVPYTYYYLRDRQALTQEISQDPRRYTESLESFTEYLNILEINSSISFRPKINEGNTRAGKLLMHGN